jgi:hemolysin III
MKCKKDHWVGIDETLSSLTHLIGGYFGAAAVVLFAVWSGTQVAWKIISGSIFASTVIMLYTFSSFYHAVTNIQARRILQICDHTAIYFLIAGTYTPFCLVSLRKEYPVSAWTIFGTVWGMTLAGIFFKRVSTGKWKFTSTIIYIVMGWICITAIRPLYASLSFPGVVWLGLGGGLYTLGTMFYLWRIVPLHHTIWHLFVLGGTVCHFFCVLLYVMMSA